MNLSTSKLFAWNRSPPKQPKPESQQGYSQASTEEKSKGVEPSAKANPLLEISAIINGPGAHPLLRALGDVFCGLDPSVFVLSEEEHEPIAAALERAVMLLEPSASRDRHLEFALAAACDESGTCQLLGSIEAALAILRRSTESKTHRSELDAALRGWQAGSSVFTNGCKEILELHLLFVFLDVKGDEVLLEQVAKQLCKVLYCSPAELAAALMRSKPWAEGALAAFALADHKELLGRRLAAALSSWRDELATNNYQSGDLSCSLPSWRDDLKPLDSAIDGAGFWEDYFAKVQNVSWPDFAEAFEEFILNGSSAPVDFLNQLRSKLDPTNSFHVSFGRWQKLAQEYETGRKLVDGLLGKVIGDIQKNVYRQEPLKKFHSRSKNVATFPEMLARVSAESESSQSTADAPDDLSARKKQAEDSHSDVHALGLMGSSGQPASSTIPTPLERAPGLAPAPERTEQQYCSWDEYCAKLYIQNRPFWNRQSVLSAEEISREESLRMSALRMVQSNVAYTNRAMLLRVVGGNLSQDRMAVETKDSDSTPGKATPSIVVTPGASRFGSATRFGRGSSRSKLQLDYTMTEPIASRSHFSVFFDQSTNKYCVADCGSKWGTFMRITEGSALSCGDWIRVGNVEFIVRFCGGGCSSKKGHSHYKLHCMKTLQEQSGSRLSLCRSFFNSPPKDDKSDEEAPDDELPIFLSGRRRHGWMSTAAQLAQQSAMRSAGCESFNNSGSRMGLTVPVSPLEVDFISGAKMGERVVLNNRLSTLGRGDDNSIQVSDSAFGNVSRVHCLFEYVDGRWFINDNNSTNGTWRRLSCILEPSKLLPVEAGQRILAGVHEMQVEDAQLNVWSAPSLGSVVIDRLREQSSL